MNNVPNLLCSVPNTEHFVLYGMLSTATLPYCIVLYSFIVQVDRTQLILHTSSFAYMVYLPIYRF